MCVCGWGGGGGGGGQLTYIVIYTYFNRTFSFFPARHAPHINCVMQLNFPENMDQDATEAED